MFYKRFGFIFLMCTLDWAELCMNTCIMTQLVCRADSYYKCTLSYSEACPWIRNCINYSIFVKCNPSGSRKLGEYVIFERLDLWGKTIHYVCIMLLITNYFSLSSLSLSPLLWFVYNLKYQVRYQIKFLIGQGKKEGRGENILRR